MKPTYTFTTLFFLFPSCMNSENKKNVDSIADAVTQIIYGQELDVDLFLANPYQLEVVDSLLFVMDNVEGHAIAIYDMKNNRTIDRVIKEGQGPEEILRPISMDISPNNKFLSIFQRQNGVYKEYKIDDLILSNILPENNLKFEQADRLLKLNNGFLTIGSYEKGMFTLWDEDGTRVNVINTYPDYLQSIEDPITRYKLNQGYMAYNKQTEKIIFASYFTGDIIFYNLADNSLHEFEKYNFGNNRFKNRIERTGEIDIDKEDVIHCFGMNSTKDYFYVLYSGERMDSLQKAKQSYVIKYNANGELITCYQTDRPLRSLCISEGDNTMYAVSLSENLDYVIIKYDLNE